MKKISILGQVYIVRKVKNLAKDAGYEGVCDASTYTILIDSGLRGQHLRRVLYHEIAHAFCFENGLGEFLSRDSMEMFAQTMSSFLVQIRKNL